MLRKRRSSLGVEARPWTSSCQEKLAGCPALTFSRLSAASVIGQVMLSSVIWPPCTPSKPELQRLHHAAQARIAGQHLHQALRLGQHLELRVEFIGRLEQEAVLREERAALRLLDRAEQILLLRRAAATSASVASSTSSGVGASMTATIISNCGKAFSNAASRCRHGMSVEIS